MLANSTQGATTVGSVRREADNWWGASNVRLTMWERDGSMLPEGIYRLVVHQRAYVETGEVDENEPRLDVITEIRYELTGTPTALLEEVRKVTRPVERPTPIVELPPVVQPAPAILRLIVGNDEKPSRPRPKPRRKLVYRFRQRARHEAGDPLTTALEQKRKKAELRTREERSRVRGTCCIAQGRGGRTSCSRPL